MRNLFFFFVTIIFLSSCITVVQQKSPEDQEAEKNKQIDHDLELATQAMKNIESRYKHQKGINPDPQIPIVSYKLTQSELMTHMIIKFKNKSKEPISHIEFVWRIFDKDGKELRYDKDQRGVGDELVNPGQTYKGEWSFNKMTAAKTAEIKLKTVQFENIIKDY